MSSANDGGGDAPPTSAPDSSDSTPPPAARGGAISRVMAHMSANKIEAALWLSRIFTVISTIMFILPFFGSNPFSCYQRALLSNAVTSALRLHQRLPHFQLSREFLSLLLLEDSAHYLFYSVMFVSSHPITMVLIPVFLFALMHATNYTKQLLNQIGPDALMLVRNLVQKLDQQQRNILRFIACNEIFILPALVFMIFTGQSSLFIPFIYYRFLCLRYTSRRNPYCRQLFYELRVTTETLCARPQCPGVVRTVCHKVISLVLRLAPAYVPVAAATAQQ